MPPKRKYRKSGLAKRLSILETKQKADDKNTEHKIHYYQSSQQMSNTWGALTSLTPIVLQGLEAEGGNIVGAQIYSKGRIGNEINLRSLTLEGFVELPKSLDGTPNFPLSQIPCRIIMVDNLTDNTPLTAADVLADPFNSTRSIVSSYKNSANSGLRYRVHADYNFTITGQKDKRIHFKMKLPKSGRKLHFQSGAAANPSDFNMSVLFFADISPAATNFPNFTYLIKSRFTDA